MNILVHFWHGQRVRGWPIFWGLYGMTINQGHYYIVVVITYGKVSLWLWKSQKTPEIFSATLWLTDLLKLVPRWRHEATSVNSFEIHIKSSDAWCKPLKLLAVVDRLDKRVDNVTVNIDEQVDLWQVTVLWLVDTRQVPVYSVTWRGWSDVIWYYTHVLSDAASVPDIQHSYVRADGSAMNKSSPECQLDIIVTVHFNKNEYIL